MNVKGLSVIAQTFGGGGNLDAINHSMGIIVPHFPKISKFRKQSECFDNLPRNYQAMNLTRVSYIPGL